MAKEPRPRPEPERTLCRACGTIDVARPVTINGLKLLICPKCGTLRAAEPKGR